MGPQRTGSRRASGPRFWQKVFAALFVVCVVGTLQDFGISWLQGLVCPYSRLTLERG